ncbi:MAG: CRISPR-associated helicase Cas3' [Clostridiales bacterium]|nr:CRISPR-associated helicase Cas3' [Clostridiales bacterium]
MIWAKTNPYKGLTAHMIDVGNMAAVLLEQSVAKTVLSLLSKSMSGRIKETVSCLIALHDIGKCHPYFQMSSKDPDLLSPLIETGLIYKDEPAPPAFRHERESERLLKELMKKNMHSARAISYFSRIAALHHQPIQPAHTELLNPNRYAGWIKLQQEMIEKICEIFKPDWRVLDTCVDFDACCTSVWGLMMLADWLASGQEAFQIPEEADLLSYSRLSRLAAIRALQNAGLKDGIHLPNRGIYGLFPQIPPNHARPVQEVCEALRISWQEINDYPLITLIEAPMGEGKTEAAVSLAAALMEGWGKTGVYFALPTAATSNCMHARISECLIAQGIHSTRLLHGHAWLVDDAGFSVQETKNSQTWLAPMRRAMIAPYGVGTVDQAMMAVLRIRFTVIRLVGLAGKVLVIDEVHAYDAYMQQTLFSLLAWAKALRIPVILLSATLPSLKRSNLFSAAGCIAPEDNQDTYPLVTCGYEDGKVIKVPVSSTYMKQTVRLQCKPWMNNPEAVALFTLNKVADGGCIGVIVNTVGDAQKLYLEMNKHNHGKIPVYLFHARFPMDKRQEIENTCVGLFGKTGERPKQAILVATQVVEQSIDLDLDYLITMLCPVDLLLQRIGRMHRHERIRPKGFEHPQVLVLTPENESELKKAGSSFVYALWILKKTWQNIIGLEAIRLPEDIRSLVEQTYSASSQTDTDYMDWASMTFRDAAMRERAKSYTFPEPRKSSFFMCEGDGLFTDEEENGTLVQSASTRFEDGYTTRIVFVTNEELQQSDSFSLHQEMDLLRRSASIPRHWIAESGITQAPGRGKLHGIQLLLSSGGVCHGATWRLRMDEKIGFVKEDGSGL